MLKREDVEVKLKVPIAYQKMIDLLSKLTADLSDLLGTVDRIIRSFGEFNTASMRSEIRRSREVKREIESLKSDLIDYISKAAPALYAKEEWMRVLSKLSGISDKAMGIMYRVEQLLVNKWEIPEDVQAQLSKLSESVVEMLGECKSAVSLIGINPDGALEACRRVELIEKRTDELYRRANFLIIRSSASFREILLLKDIAEMLEEISDTMESIVDDVRVILMGLA